MSALTEQYRNFAYNGQNATFPLQCMETREMLQEQTISAKDVSMRAFTERYNFTCMGQNATLTLQSIETREKLKEQTISAKDDSMSALTEKYHNSTSKGRTRLSDYTLQKEVEYDKSWIITEYMQKTTQ
jgi:hypothetical protein